MSMTKEERRVYNKLWRIKNRERVLSIKRKYRQNNKDAIQEYGKKWRKEHPEHKQYGKEWRKANKEKVDAYHRSERQKIAFAKYQKTERGRAKFSSYYHTRKARKLNQLGPNPPTTEQILELLSKPCAYCGKKSQHLDHIIPLSKGGLHDITNVTGACKPCNLSKGSKLLLEW